MENGKTIGIRESHCIDIPFNAGNHLDSVLLVSFRATYGLVKVKRVQLFLNFHLTVGDDIPMYITIFPWKRQARFNVPNTSGGEAVPGALTKFFNGRNATASESAMTKTIMHPGFDMPVSGMVAGHDRAAQGAGWVDSEFLNTVFWPCFAAAVQPTHDEIVGPYIAAYYYMNVTFMCKAIDFVNAVDVE